MWGAQEKSEGAHFKNFRPALRAGIVPPHLQIASDATVAGYLSVHLMTFDKQSIARVVCASNRSPIVVL